jgi:hypothetical protein
VTEWELADDRNNREKINRARQAAEDLFKPTQQTASAELPASASDAVSSGAQQPRRQPRIFTLPPRVSVNAEDETPTAPKPIRRKAAPQRKTESVPSSHAGRVRVLTSYGMTRAQVAELYGVSVDEIERIIRGSGDSGKSR